MTPRADLIKAGIIKPSSKVFANPAAKLARQRDAVTKTEKALRILEAAVRRRYRSHNAQA